MNQSTHEPAKARTQAWRRASVELAVIVLVALVAALGIREWVVQTYWIPSGSMEPTIEVHERVLVDRLAFDFGHVSRGDIIVFAKPSADIGSTDIHDLIKRVIGLPGESLRSGPNGQIFVDGKPIAQPWVTAAVLKAAQPTICDPAPGFSRIDCVGDTLHLPKGEYYVLGDNRSDSDDSRYWGPVAAHLIIGQAFVCIWPLSHIHWL
jgi:signal peptidase I